MANGNSTCPNVVSISERIAIWKGKELHGSFYRALTEPDVD